ncbi:hypothetical protein [Photobacterium sp. DNB22_13_2]
MLWKQLIKSNPAAFYPVHLWLTSYAHKRSVSSGWRCWLGFIGVLYQPAFD